MKIVIALLSFFVFDTSFAGVHTNNGGAIILCSNMDKPLVIDLYLAKKDSTFRMKFAQGDAFERATESIDVLKKFDVRLYEKFAQNLTHIKQTYQLTTEKIRDDLYTGSYYYDIGADCKHEFVAVQNNELLTISQQWWQQASFENQIALVLHEVTYLYAREFGFWSADHVYPMVKFLLSQGSDKWTASEFQALLKRLTWDGIFYLNGRIPLEMQSIEKDDEGRVTTAVLAKDFTENVGQRMRMTHVEGSNVSFNRYEIENMAHIAQGSARQISFFELNKKCRTQFPAEQVSTFTRGSSWYIEEMTATTPYQSIVLPRPRAEKRDGTECDSVEIEQYSLSFYPTGIAKKLHLKKPALLHQRFVAQKLLLAAEAVELFEDGYVKSGRLAEARELFCGLGQSTQKLPAQTFVEFDKLGKCVRIEN